MVLESLDSELDWFERPAQAIVDHLAEVTREGDEAILRIANAVYRIHGPTADELAPPIDEEEADEDWY